MTAARRTLLFLILAAAFGVVAGAFKGDETGLRGGIGNLSAPWLLVAFLPALRCRSALRGALVGLLSTLAALLGFYAVLTVVLAGHLGGGGFGAELQVEVTANRVYFVAGAATAPLLGAFGAWLGRRHREATWIVVGALLAGEVLAVVLAEGHQLAPPPFYFRWGVVDWRPYILESALGLAVLLTALTHRGWTASTDERGGRFDTP